MQYRICTYRERLVDGKWTSNVTVAMEAMRKANGSVAVTHDEVDKQYPEYVTYSTDTKAGMNIMGIVIVSLFVGSVLGATKKAKPLVDLFDATEKVVMAMMRVVCL